MSVAAERDVLNLSKLEAGKTLQIEGDDGVHDFKVNVAGKMPSGILRSQEDYGIVLAQCVGMVPFAHNWSQLVPELEPGVLKTEYGKLVFLCVSNDSQSHDFRQLCVGNYTILD